MSEAQNAVLKAIKNGCITRKEIAEKTGHTIDQVCNYLQSLRKWTLVTTDGHGHYSIAGQEKKSLAEILGKEENNL